MKCYHIHFARKRSVSLYMSGENRAENILWILHAKYEMYFSDFTTFNDIDTAYMTSLL